MKYLALDYGEKRIGLAGSDSGTIVTPLEVFEIKNNDFTLLIQKIIQYDPKYLIIGLPVSTNGQEKESAQKVRQFVNYIKDKIKVIKLEYTNEIYTSTEARERAKTINWKKGKPIDHFAAAIILEQFLNSSKASN